MSQSNIQLPDTKLLDHQSWLQHRREELAGPESWLGLAGLFWLEEGLPASLAPGKRPRTTLTPTLAHFDGKPTLVIGTPGGDQQDQWQLTMFLRHVHHGLKEAIACA